MQRHRTLAIAIAALFAIGGLGAPAASASTDKPRAKTKSHCVQRSKGSDGAVDATRQGKKGGTLSVLSAGDVDFLDPGKTYYVYSIGIMNA